MHSSELQHLFRYLVPVSEEANHFRDELISNDRNSLPVFHEHVGQLIDIVFLLLEIHVFNLMDVQRNSDDFFWFMMTFVLTTLSVNNDRFSETEK